MPTITIKDKGKLSTSKMMKALKKKFDVYSYWNDKELDTNFPKPKKATERSFSMSKKPDVLYKSWDDMADIRESMMTFREYILFFEAYHEETGEYPDVVGWTIFKDSLPDGDVADGCWDPASREVRFGWYYADNRNSDSGGRVAISLNSSSPNPSPKKASEIAVNEYKERLGKEVEGMKRDKVTGGFDGENDMNIEIATYNETLTEVLKLIKEK